MNELERFKTDLRSVLLQAKSGIPMHRLNSEYRDLMGSNIQYDRRLYQTLDSYLLTMPDTVKLRRFVLFFFFLN